MNFNDILSLAKEILGSNELICYDCGNSYSFSVKREFIVRGESVVISKNDSRYMDNLTAMRLGMITLEEPIEIDIETGEPK